MIECSPFIKLWYKNGLCYKVNHVIKEGLDGGGGGEEGSGIHYSFKI